MKYPSSNALFLGLTLFAISPLAAALDSTPAVLGGPLSQVTLAAPRASNNAITAAMAAYIQTPSASNFAALKQTVEDARNNNELPTRRVTPGSNLVNDGEGTADHRVDMADTTDSMHLEDNATLTLKNNVAPQLVGGAINLAAGGLMILTSDNTSSVHSYRFQNNVALDGGAVSSDGNAWIHDALFDNNLAVSNGSSAQSHGGGAIDTHGGMLIITQATFSNNSTVGDGGAIFNDAAQVRVSNTVFSNNGNINTSTYGLVTAVNGGAVSTRGGTFMATDSTFSSNQAMSRGGAINVTGGTLMINNSNFTNNQVNAPQNDGRGGAINIQSGAMSLIDTSFINNKVNGDGGAIYTPAGNEMLTDVNFIGNSATGVGGAIRTSGILTQNVRAGESSVYAGNSNAGQANSIHFNGTGNTYSIWTDVRSTLYMYDPMTSDNVAISKTGAGTWELAGNNALGNSSVTINEGRFEMLNSGSYSYQTASYPYAPAVLSIGDDGAYTLAAHAQMKVYGDNQINGGLQSYAGRMGFDMTAAQADSGNSHFPRLLANTYDFASLAGSGGVRVYNWQNLSAGLYTLVDAILPDSTIKGTLYDGDSNSPYTFVRTTTPGTPVMALIQKEDERYLELLIGDAADPADLTWTGEQNNGWDIATSSNWIGEFMGQPVKIFHNNDSVTFSNKTTNARIDFVPTAVTVNNMTVENAHSFKDAKITVNGQLRLWVNMSGPTLIMTGNPSLTFGPNATLALVGHVFGKGQAITPVAVVDNNGITNWQDMTTDKITLSGAAVNGTYDFMSTTVDVQPGGITLTTALSWYHSALVANAHGNFTLPQGDTFTLSVGLDDNQADANASWDGTTLTKKGPGTLILTGDNTYTGKTTVEAGELAIGDGGTEGSVVSDIEIAGNAVLRFNRADDIVFDKTLSGSGTIQKNGAAQLTINGQQPFSGTLVVNRGQVNINGSLAGGVNALARSSVALRGSLGTASSFAPQASLYLYQGARLADLAADNANLHFWLPAAIADGGQIAEAGTTTINKANISVGIDGGNELTAISEGATVVLLNTQSLSATGIKPLTVKIGSLIEWDATISSTPTQLLLHFPESGSKPSDSAEGIEDGQPPAVGGLIVGGDLIADLFPALTACAPNCKARQVFGVVDAYKQKIDNVANVDLKGFAALTGMTWQHTGEEQRLFTGGGFFEYGKNSFDSDHHTADGARVRGDGDTRYIGGGLLARYDFAASERGQPYAEAAFRFGRVEVEYHSHDLISYTGDTAHYDEHTTYFGALLAGGYKWRLDERSTLDSYARLQWTRQNSYNVKVSTGERVDFDDLTSLRTRLGARYGRWTDEQRRVRWHAGLAYEYEFDGKVKAQVEGMPIPEQDMKGGSGIIAAGVQWLPHDNRQLSIDAKLEGYVGKRQGVAGLLRAQYWF